MRLATICPSNTELAVYMGLEKYLVGTDNYSDWPEGIVRLPKLGPDLSIDMDALAALKPDLVLASLSVPGMEKNVEALKERGIPHIVLNSSSLDGIGACFLTIGEATGMSKEARAAYDTYMDKLNGYRERKHKSDSSGIQIPSIYWEWWPKPVFTPGGGNWLTEISELAGGRNLFADKPEASVKTDWETVVARKPDIIALAWVGVRKNQVRTDAVMNREGAGELEAVRHHRIYVMEEALFCRPSPRLLEGLDTISTVIHSIR